MHGHESVEKVERSANRWNLDTGAGRPKPGGAHRCRPAKPEQCEKSPCQSVERNRTAAHGTICETTGPTTAKRNRAQGSRSPHPLLLPIVASLPALIQAGCDLKRPYRSREEPLSADSAGPAPSAQKPVHGINQIRVRNSRERTERPRMRRNTQHSGASPLGTANSPRFHRHARVVGNVSRHHRRHRRNVSTGIPTCGRPPPGVRRRPAPARSPPQTAAPHGIGVRRSVTTEVSHDAGNRRSRN